MLYLYLGFLLANTYSVVKVIYTSGIPFLTIVFSVLVFLIWSFFPVVGYGVARLIGAKGHTNKYTLLGIGIGICLIEKLLYEQGILANIDGYLVEGYVGITVTTIMFFIAAFIPFEKGINLVIPKQTTSA
ncbi:hypothetical protein [Litoribrevibacter albus]|uniref:Uncharacterized protein n=1 Tax=Litoribrevibacter albus TaxID=1473156 RepID=A0AA37SA00_9GAMM|nr:hypothetical protein [Litoribrevibacter albus]GLQ30859.1 hypothetical protein GCM10007876_13380 [Litoribrevibacter albus]